MIEYLNDNSPETAFQEFRPKPDPVNEPSFSEVAGAAFRVDNDVYAAYKGVTQPFFEEESDHNPLDTLEGTVYEQYLDSFVGSRSQAQTDFIKQKIDNEIADRELLADGGNAGLASSIAAGIVSPTILLPGGAFFKGAKTGQVAGRTALSTGVAGGAAVGIQEGILQSTQETRTAEESAINIGSGILLSGLIGGVAAGAISATERKTLSKSLEDFQDVFEVAEDEFTTLGQNASAGAAQADTRAARLKDEAFIKKLPIINQQDPTIRLKVSDNQVSRRAVNDLAENPLENVENENFVPSSVGGSVEARMKVWQGPLAESVTDLSDNYSKYFYGKEAGRFAKATAPLRSELTRHNKLTYQEFKTEVGKALRRGDVHEIAEVEQAAKTFRSKIFEPGKKAAIDAGIFDEGVDITTAQSYLTRVYNQELISARRTDFKDIVQKHFNAERVKASQLADELRAQGKNVDDKLQEFADFAEGEVELLVEDVIDRILGNAEGRIPYDIVQGPRGPLRERVLNIPDLDIEDFLESDVEMIGRQYTRTMSADVELTKKFGDVDLKEKTTEIREQYNKMIDSAKTEKQKQSLEKLKKRDIEDVEAIRDRLRGTFAQPKDPSGALVRSGRFIRNLNYLRLLGGMTLSAIPDLAKPVFVHGLSRTVKTGILPMMKSFKTFKAGADEVKLAGTALDMALDTRAMAIADIMDNYGRHSKFERMTSEASSKFGIVSLMAPWNATLKQVAGNIAMTRMLQAMTAKSISKADTKLLAASGIDRNLANRIAKEFNKHGKKQDGLYLPNTLEWTDLEARSALRAALVRDVDRVVVTPGQDKPLWMSTETGALIGQFKSFGVASIQRTMLAGMQQRDAAAFSGAMMMLALGGVAYASKEAVAGRSISDDPNVWMANALDRSGLLGWISDANNITEKATGGVVGLSAITGEQISRYQSRNITGAFLGPSADAVADLFQLSSSGFKGEMKESDLRKARRLLPFQNLFYLRSLFDEAEGAIAKEAGLK